MLSIAHIDSIGLRAFRACPMHAGFRYCQRKGKVCHRRQKVAYLAIRQGTVAKQTARRESGSTVDRFGSDCMIIDTAETQSEGYDVCAHHILISPGGASDEGQHTGLSASFSARACHS